MHEVADRSQPYAKDFIGTLTADLCNHTDSAGIVLESRIIERGFALMEGHGMVHGMYGERGLWDSGSIGIERYNVVERAFPRKQMAFQIMKKLPAGGSGPPLKSSFFNPAPLYE